MLPWETNQLHNPVQAPPVSVSVSVYSGDPFPLDPFPFDPFGDDLSDSGSLGRATSAMPSSSPTGGLAIPNQSQLVPFHNDVDSNIDEGGYDGEKFSSPWLAANTTHSKHG